MVILPDLRCVLHPVRAPSGAVIGNIVEEDGVRVFVRPISEVARGRVLFRDLDGWPLGEHALDQIRRWSVETIRYVAPEGVYETPLAEFLARAIPLDFPHERQWVLPRAWWPVRPAAAPGRAIDGIARAVQTDLFLGAAP